MLYFIKKTKLQNRLYSIIKIKDFNNFIVSNLDLIYLKLYLKIVNRVIKISNNILISSVFFNFQV